VAVLGLRIAAAQTEGLPLHLLCSHTRYDHPFAQSTLPQRQTTAKRNFRTGQTRADLDAVLNELWLILRRQAWASVSGFKGQR
jgi:hypothetical protein